MITIFHRNMEGIRDTVCEQQPNAGKTEQDRWIIPIYNPVLKMGSIVCSKQVMKHIVMHQEIVKNWVHNYSH